MIIFNRSINNNVSVSVLDGTNPTYIYIPSIYYDGVNDNTVTGISENGFADLTNLENIIIPNTIVSIDDGALSGCTNLSTLDIPTSVTSIGAGALSDCTSLTTVTIPDSVTAIGDSLFAGCANLSSVTIPSTIVSIGANAFSGCESLSEITIPTSVTEIGSGALSGCTSLTEIVIPSSVTTIGSNVFSDSPNLTNITIAPGNTAFTTDGKAFYNSTYTILQKYYATADTSYSIPSTVVTTDNYSFQNATALTSMTISSTITSIGEYMFTGCSGLESVVFSSGSTGVSNGMFASCSNITSVSLPSSLTSIGNYGFSQCTSLVGIDLTYIKSIGDNAFADCSNISTLIIEDQCTSIGASAFANCSSVSMIRFVGNYPTIGANAFSGLASDAVIYFNPEKTGWTNYATINGVSTIALVYISGTFTQQQTLTANTKLVESGVVPNGTVFTYQWYEDSSPISGATASTLVLKYDQVDKTIHVVVSYNINGALTTLTSISSAAVDAFNNSPTGTVSISGSNTPSSVLTATNTIADVDGLGTFYYQWYRNTTSSNVGGTAITDATTTTYTLSGIDANAYIYVKLYYTDNYGTPEIVYSSPTVQIVGLPPSDVAATATSATTASISFTPSENVTSYTVTSSPGGITSSGTSSPIVVSGLTGNTTYTFTMTSAYGSYTTPSSEASNSVKTYIAAPTNVVATATSSTTATVTFTAPTGGSANAISYTLSGLGDGSYDLSGTTFSVTGLTSNTVYTFTVNATSTSNSTSTAATEISTYPGVPTIVEATPTSVTTATVTFTIPTGGSANIITYTLSGLDGASYDLSGTTFTVSGLTEYTAYTCNVIATSIVGSTSSSGSSFITTSYSPPSYLSASSYGDESSIITFETNPGAINYEVYAYIDGNDTIFSTTTGNTSPITVSGLTVDTSFNFKVASVFGSYTSSPSIASNTVEIYSSSGLTISSNRITGFTGTQSNVMIPSSVLSIGSTAFANKTGIQKIYIGSGVTSISVGSTTHSFVGCSNINTFTIHSSNTIFSTDGYSLFNAAGTILYQYMKQTSASYTVPNTINIIGAYAFGNCSSLTSLTIGSGVTSISVATTTHSFVGCSNINTFTIDPSNTVFSTDGYSLFNAAGTILYQYMKQSSASYTVPNTILSIGAYAFGNCSSLTSLAIGSGVASISVATTTHSFVGCSNINTFTIDPSNTFYSSDGYSLLNASGTTLYHYMKQSSASYTVPNTILTIGAYAFGNCSSLTSLTIGSGVTSISVATTTHSFVGCSNINTFTINIFNTTYSTDGYSLLDAAGTTLYHYMKQSSASYTIPNTILTIGVYAFGNCSSLTSLTIGSGVTSIVGTTTLNHPFVGCSNINTFEVHSSNTIYSTDGYSLLNKLGTSIYLYMKQSSASYTIPNTIRTILTSAFCNCTSLTSLSIGSGVTSIVTGALNHSFVGCSNINTFTIHSSNTTYSTDGYSLFNKAGTILYHYITQSSASYTVPNTILTIGAYAFGNCSSLTSLAIGSGVTSITVGSATHSFVGCSNINTFTIHSSNNTYSTDGYSLLNKAGTTLWNYITQGLDSYTIPNTIVLIGGYAFGNCSRLTSVSIGSGVTGINIALPTHSFIGCSNINTFTVHPSNSTYSTDGYSLLNKAGTILYLYIKRASTSYIIPNTITTLNTFSFNNCSELTSVSIGSSVTTINQDVFNLCRGLVNITIPNSVTSIGTGLFVSCSGLTNVTIGSGITSIPNVVFGNCTSLSSFIIPDTVKSISTNTFLNCTALSSVSIGSGLTSISVGGTTHSFIGCTAINTFIISASNTTYSTDGYSLLNKAGTILYLYVNRTLTSYTIPNTITTLNTYSFYNCIGLTTLTIPESVTSVGANGVTTNANLATIIFNGNRPTTITVATSFVSNKSGCIGYYYPNKTGWPGTAITGLTLTSLLAVTGSKSANGTLTATEYLSTIGATGLTYQWYSNSSNSNTGGSAISFATSSSFTHGSAYTYVYIIVNYTLSGSSTSLTSNAF